MLSSSKLSKSKRNPARPALFCGEVTPDAPEILALWRRHFDGDESAAAKLLKHFAPLAWREARNAQHRSPALFIDSTDELASDGLIGIYRALRNAKPGERFVLSARRAARSQIGRGQRQRRGFTVRVIDPDAGIARQVRADAVTTTGILPSESEVSSHVAGLITNPNIQLQFRRPPVIHFSMTRDDERPQELADANAEAPDTRALDRETIKLALKGLSGGDRNILSLLLKGYSQTEIAAELGLSRQRVHQRLNGVLWESRQRADLARHLGVEPASQAKPQTKTHRSPISGRKLLRMVG